MVVVWFLVFWDYFLRKIFNIFGSFFWLSTFNCQLLSSIILLRLASGSFGAIGLLSKVVLKAMSLKNKPKKMTYKLTNFAVKTFFGYSLQRRVHTVYMAYSIVTLIAHQHLTLVLPRLALIATFIV